MQLSSLISNVYNGRTTNRYWNNNDDIEYEEKYLKVPIQKDEIIEIPVCIMRTLMQSRDIKLENYDEFAIRFVNPNDNTTNYVSVEPMFKDVFMGQSILRKVVVRKNALTYTYYGMNGFILNSDCTPIVMASWQTKLHRVREDGYQLKDSKPILRIAPEVFDRSNPFLSFLSGKLLTTVANTGLLRLYSDTSVLLSLSSVYNRPVQHIPIAVVIEKIPFSLVAPTPPHIDTTKEKLLNVVFDNKEELI